MKVLLLDDHPLVRSALDSVIRSLSCDVTVFPVATVSEARCCLTEDGPIDLALLDLILPDGDGFSLMAEWRRAYPDMPVVIISASEQPCDAMRALDEGALGYIPKRTANEVLMQALKMVMSGGIYVPPMVLTMAQASQRTRPDSLTSLLQAHEPSPGHASLQGSHYSERLRSPHASSAGRGRVGFGAVSSLRLTPRQYEVLELLLQGQPNKLIARQLNLSVETVKDHVASLLRVLGVSSRTQAVLAVGQMMGTAGSLSPDLPRSASPITSHSAA